MQHPKARGETSGPTGKLTTSGANRDSQNPTTRSTKAVDRRSPRYPTSEKRRPSRITELETQLARLQDELEKSNARLTESESWKKEADEAKKQLAAMSAKLDESQQQLDELWACEESRIQELRKISQDRDRAWESELKAVQKHHSMDLAALAAAMNENQKLRIQLQKVAESEAAQAKHAESAHDEVLTLRLELSETLDLLEELKTQLNESSKDSEEYSGESGGDLGLQVAAPAGNEEMEGELRRLRVHAEQWRKAAEAAAAMVFDGNGGGGGAAEPLDSEDEPSNKKYNNVLKRLGVLLKKG